MEPRPQRPPSQQPTQPSVQGTPEMQQPASGGPQSMGQFGQPFTQENGTSTFSASPRMQYDYSPLDLEPPAQRHKRQMIAGIIGALAVVAIAALIVVGWRMLSDDATTPGTTTDRVAELTPNTNDDGDTDAPATNTGTAVADATPTPLPTLPPPTPTPLPGKVFDNSSIRSALPVVESMPGAFSEAGDLPQDLEGVTDALGGGPDVEAMLADNGWQASMARTFVSDNPADTGSTQIVVSVHAFKDGPSADNALPAFATILESYGWTPVESEQLGDGSRMLVWTDPATGEEAVTIYFRDGQLLYRVFAIGPNGYDSGPNVIYVVHQILGR